MTKKVIILKKETDWATEFGAYAVNRDSRLFENTSCTTGMKLELYDSKEEDFDENEVANALARVFSDERIDYEYALYDTQHHLIGFAYYIPRW